MKILLTFLILFSANSAFAFEERCFKNNGLQSTNFVELEVSENMITGKYSVENSGDGESAKTYQFSGTLAGDALKVKFEGDVLPDVAPSEIKDLNWTVLKSGDEEILRIKFYGKNYKTNKYADYFADFEQCSAGYVRLSKKAKVVRFAKGKQSAKVPLSFDDTSEQKVFSINIRRGQTLDIDASSCSITVYQPDKERYQFVEDEYAGKKSYASTTIDGLLIEPIPQTGNYLVVLRKLSDDSPITSATFKINK